VSLSGPASAIAQAEVRASAQAYTVCVQASAQFTTLGRVEMDSPVCEVQLPGPHKD
jgi:hypothetical protein